MIAMVSRTFIGFFFLITAAQLSSAATRHYYIAAEDVMWDYAPSHRDLIHIRLLPLPWAAKTQFHKTRYVEYTDSTFTVKKPQPEWLGILGPVIRAEVGDEIVVDFLNRSASASSMHPHGLHYDKNNEGASYVLPGSGASIDPGAHFTYHWFADERNGPGPDDPSSVVRMYHSHVEPSTEADAGLMGPIIITAKGKAKPDGSPKDVDQEIVMMFMIFDELMGVNAPEFRPMTYFNRSSTDNTGLFYSINGYIFGNLPEIALRKGAKVRWYLLGMGGEKDLHTPHWHGEMVRHDKRNTDVVELLPASMTSADMIADNLGTWLFHCQVSDHMEAGMMATYTIYDPEDKRSCPIKFRAKRLWGDSAQDLSLTIENNSSKTINKVVLNSANLLSRMDLEPSVLPWIGTAPMPPGHEQTLTSKNNLNNSNAIPAWVFFPRSIEYSDGSRWQTSHQGQCFEIYWRDKDHPDLPVLPPLQIELNVD